MTIQEEIHGLGVKARAAAQTLRAYTTEQKNAALEAAKDEIGKANAEDVKAAAAEGLSPAMLDRLTLTDKRFAAMVQGVRDIIALADPVGETIWTRTRPSGIEIAKVREPFGVIAVVFESRPNVFVDTASLCLKTSNAIILRGGHEAIRSNKALNAAVRRGLALAGLPADAVQFVENPDQESPRVIDVTIREELSGRKLLMPYAERGLVVLGRDEEATRLRVRLAKEECAVIVIQ